MPTYSYRCTACEHAFDIHQAFTEDALTVCPNCGGLLRKVFSPIGVTFSGSGFYRTDSRAKPENSSGDGAGGGGASKDSGTKDSGAAKKEPAAKPAASNAASGS